MTKLRVLVLSFPDFTDIANMWKTFILASPQSQSSGVLEILIERVQKVIIKPVNEEGPSK
jgi:hypothetical protein